MSNKFFFKGIQEIVVLCTSDNECELLNDDDFCVYSSSGSIDARRRKRDTM